MAVLNVSLLFHFQKQPYYHDDADQLESYSLMIVQVLNVCVVLCAPVKGSGQPIHTTLPSHRCER